MIDRASCLRRQVDANGGRGSLRRRRGCLLLSEVEPAATENDECKNCHPNPNNSFHAIYRIRIIVQVYGTPTWCLAWEGDRLARPLRHDEGPSVDSGRHDGNGNVVFGELMFGSLLFPLKLLDIAVVADKGRDERNDAHDSAERKSCREHQGCGHTKMPSKPGKGEGRGILKCKDDKIRPNNNAE